MHTLKNNENHQIFVENHGFFLILSSVLVGFIVFLVCLSANIVKIAQYNQNITTDNSISWKIEELSQINREITLIIDRLSRFPSNYYTASTKASESLVGLHNRKALLVESISNNTLETKQSLETNYKTLFIILMFLTYSLLGILCLWFTNCIIVEKEKQLYNAISNHKLNITSTLPQKIAPMAYYEAPIDSQRFLDAAKYGSDLPFLHGRDKTAKMLGITCADGKRMVARLIDTGLIEVCGKRLKLKS
jgi:hypothetical protein